MKAIIGLNRCCLNQLNRGVFKLHRRSSKSSNYPPPYAYLFKYERMAKQMTKCRVLINECCFILMCAGSWKQIKKKLNFGWNMKCATATRIYSLWLGQLIFKLISQWLRIICISTHLQIFPVSKTKQHLPADYETSN